MRDIYSRTNTINDFQQGVILNNCIAEDYIEKEVFGIIITPRCDIENSKVNTVHYLPIVKLEDWISVDFQKILKGQIQKDIISKLMNFLNSNSHSTSILNLFKTATLLKHADNLFSKQKDRDKFVDLLNDLDNLEKDNLTKEISRKYINSIGKNILKELKENRRKEFYLIESWDNNESLCIVLLREIKRVTINLAEKYSTGFFEESLTDFDFNKNDICKMHDPENFFCTIAKMHSPYIEHLIQSFFHNFGRIGINDLDDNADDILLRETYKVIAK